MNQRVVKAQENVATITSLINKWNEMPLFARIKEERVEPLLNIEGANVKSEKTLQYRLRHLKVRFININYPFLLNIRHGSKKTSTIC